MFLSETELVFLSQESSSPGALEAIQERLEDAILPVFESSCRSSLMTLPPKEECEVQYLNLQLQH